MDASLKPYFDWMETHLKGRNLACMCTPVCIAMKCVFPELLIMSGDVCTEDGGLLYEHTWLQTESGTIIDPTEDQFSSHIVEYHATMCDSTDPVERAVAESHFP